MAFAISTNLKRQISVASIVVGIGVATVFVQARNFDPLKPLLVLSISGNSIGSDRVLVCTLPNCHFHEWHESIWEKMADSRRVVGISGSSTSQPLLADVRALTNKGSKKSAAWVDVRGRISQNSSEFSGDHVRWDHVSHTVLSPDRCFVAFTYQDPPEIKAPLVEVLDRCKNQLVYASRPPSGSWDASPVWSQTSSSLLYTRVSVTKQGLLASIKKYDLKSKVEGTIISNGEFVARAAFTGNGEQLVAFGPGGLALYEDGHPKRILCPLTCFDNHVYEAGGIAFSRSLQTAYIPFSDEAGGTILYSVSLLNKSLKSIPVGDALAVRETVVLDQ